MVLTAPSTVQTACGSVRTGPAMTGIRPQVKLKGVSLFGHVPMHWFVATVQFPKRGLVAWRASSGIPSSSGDGAAAGRAAAPRASRAKLVMRDIVSSEMFGMQSFNDPTIFWREHRVEEENVDLYLPYLTFAKASFTSRYPILDGPTRQIMTKDPRTVL